MKAVITWACLSLTASSIHPLFLSNPSLLPPLLLFSFLDSSSSLSTLCHG